MKTCKTCGAEVSQLLKGDCRKCYMKSYQKGYQKGWRERQLAKNIPCSECQKRPALSAGRCSYCNNRAKLAKLTKLCTVDGCTRVGTNGPNRILCKKHYERTLARARKRTRETGATYEPVNISEIYKRDNLICHICGEPCRVDLGPNHDLAPSHDHVVPLVLGGDHTPDNIKTAHRICNSRKDARTRRTVTRG